METVNHFQTNTVINMQSAWKHVCRKEYRNQSFTVIQFIILGNQFGGSINI